jgi:hypothetical protein
MVKSKKSPLLELLLCLDSDNLIKITQTLVETNPELEDRIRIYITPKKLIKTPLNYYKKQVSEIQQVPKSKSKANQIKISFKP